MSMATADNRVSRQDTFEEACGRADEKCRRAAKPEQLTWLRCLLDDNSSLERAWAELNQRHRSDAPQATVEALVFSLRDGIAALGRPATLRRLSELSAPQLREVAVRVQKFKPEIAQPWKPEDVEVLIAASIRFHG